MANLHDFLDLILPTKCVLCSRIGGLICPGCAGDFVTLNRPTERGGRRGDGRRGDGLTGASGRLIGYSASNYDEPSRLLLHAFKEKGQTALSRFMAGKLAPLLDNFESSAWLVPVPSSRANFIKRGYQPALVLAKSTRRSVGGGFLVSDSLRFSRVVADQAQLQTAGRAMNLAGSMKAHSRLSGRRVILLDDIVTTGATLLESARAVTVAGGEVSGFITFSETLLKTPAKN